MKSPELLAPAGNLRNLRYALAYGADAVYAGMPRYSLRVRNNDFNTLEQLQTGIRETHAAGRQFFLASNLLPHNAKVKTFISDITPVVALGPDALIMADPGLMMLVREQWPELPIHLSVQANTVNYAAVRFWQSVGVRRIILSRELSLDEVAEIRQLCPDMELEVFVHGALCIAYSGRCLLSGYFNHRDANQGTCTNSCRWDYKVHDAQADVSGDLQRIELNAKSLMENPEPFAGIGNGQRHPLAEQGYLIEERERPGELMPIEEDEHGTYILNSKDLRAVEHVQRLVEIGIDSLKIEGRTKSHYYVARTAQIYRRAIDDAVAGRPFDARLLGQLENLSNRGYTDGFYQRHHSQDYQSYLASSSNSEQQRFVAEVLDVDSDGLVQLDVKNKFAIGDSMELITPHGNRTFVLERMEQMNGEPLSEVPGGGWKVRVQLPVNDAAMGLLAKNLSA